MIGRLCDLGSAARRAGDALSAAADYNRALAYAPTDPGLLKIVASMHRAEARAQLVKKVGPMLLVACALGIGAFFVTRALKPKPIVIDSPPAPLLSVRPPPIALPAPAPPASADPAPSARPAPGVPRPRTGRGPASDLALRRAPGRRASADHHARPRVSHRRHHRIARRG
jgi:hypothetical protein